MPARADFAAFDDLFSPSMEPGLEDLVCPSDVFNDGDLPDLDLSDIDELLRGVDNPRLEIGQQQQSPKSSSGEQETPTMTVGAQHFTQATADWEHSDSGGATACNTSRAEAKGNLCTTSTAPLQALPSSSCSADTSGNAGQQASDTSSRHKPHAAQQQLDDDAKKKARMERNRESAHLSRERKRMQTEEIENKCRDLHTHNVQLIGLVNHLTHENALLRHHLALLSQQAGVPCPVTGPPPMGPLPGQPMMVGLPPSMPPGMCAAPLKLPIQKLKSNRAPVQPRAQQPATSAAAQPLPPAQAPTSVAAASGHASLNMPVPNSSTTLLPSQGRAKRMRKTAALACVSMLAVCAFMLLSGPSSPAAPALHHHHQQPIPLTNAHSGLASSSLVVLPGAGAPPQARRTSVGRMLAAMPDGRLPGNATAELAPDWRDAMLNGRYNESMTLMLRPNDLGAERKALTRLKEMAPMAVWNEWDERWSGSWQSYAQMARAVFGGDGLASPAHCKEVFSFDASQLPRPELVRDRLQYYAAMQALGHRARADAALPLPPASDGLQQPLAASLHASPGGERLASLQSSTVGKGEAWESEVVSIILPTKQPRNDSDTLTSLDSLLVVVLTPNTRYTTYSCALPYPIFV